MRTIRRGRWKLNVHASGEHELYNLVDDPGELHNAFYDSGVEPTESVTAIDEIAAFIRAHT